MVQPPPPPARAGGRLQGAAAAGHHAQGPTRRWTRPRQPHRSPIRRRWIRPPGAGSGAGSGSGTDPTATGTCTENCGEAPPADPVCGNGAPEAGEQCDDGNAPGGDGCSATCLVEVKPPPATVLPSVLQALRTSGETQVHPGEVDQSQMIHDGVGRVEAIVKLCITADGSVGQTRLLRSTKYPAYDAVLLAAVRDWRYQPFRVNGTAVPACSTVRFVYTIE